MKKLLELKTTLQSPSLAASVIGEDGAPWFKTLVIDRGAADGLQEGMPVIAVDGIIGRLVKVAANSSRLLLLTDHASGIAAVVQRSRARGVVKGTGDGRCSLEFSLRDEDVKVGDVVVTSGVGGGFPKGLNLGEVTMVKKGAYGIFQTVEVHPAVNIARTRRGAGVFSSRSMIKTAKLFLIVIVALSFPNYNLSALSAGSFSS